jgi:hypothetical protein
MSHCIQCGASVTPEMKACPRCARPVGDSSVGRARERQANPAARKAIVALAVLVAVAAATSGIVSLVRGRGGLSAGRLDDVAQAASASLVQVRGPSTAGGVVVRALDGALLVATQASAAPAGREVEVVRDGKSARGFGLLVGEGKVVDEFALVLVPSGASLGAKEARLAELPALDAPLAALQADGKPAGAGPVLAVDDGVLVHDAPTDGADRGVGLWSAQGRLAALPAMGKAGAEHLAVAASAVFERLLLHALGPPAGVEWSEHAVPVVAGTRVAVAYAGPGAERLTARVGDKGRAVSARAVWPGLFALEWTASSPGMLQVGGALPDPAGARALVVTLGRF